MSQNLRLRFENWFNSKRVELNGRKFWRGVPVHQSLRIRRMYGHDIRMN